LIETGPTRVVALVLVEVRRVACQGTLRRSPTIRELETSLAGEQIETLRGSHPNSRRNALHWLKARTFEELRLSRRQSVDPGFSFSFIFLIVLQTEGVEGAPPQFDLF
jgi:hypothetical protein